MQFVLLPQLLHCDQLVSQSQSCYFRLVFYLILGHSNRNMHGLMVQSVVVRCSVSYVEQGFSVSLKTWNIVKFCW